MKRWSGIGSVAAVILYLLGTAGNALAHCDTLDGPVVNLARQALAKGDVNIILPWVAADKALETGDPGPLLKLVNEKIHEGIHKYYMEAKEKKAHAGESVEAGRAYVQAYVPYLHFVERLYADASMPVAHGAGEGTHPAAGHPEPAAPAAEHKH